jgi:hypothetical protein
MQLGCKYAYLPRQRRDEMYGHTLAGYLILKRTELLQLNYSKYTQNQVPQLI